MDKNEYGFDTQCVHGNYDPFKHNRARGIPLYQSTGFLYDDTDHAASLFSFEQEGHIYMRIDNPTVKEAEDRIALLEGGIGAVCFASGMAAITGFILNFLKSGDKILSGNTLYGGTSGLFKDTLPKLGIETVFFDSNDVFDFKKKLDSSFKLVWIENLANPSLVIPDIKLISDICKEYKIPLCVDNTIATPFLSNPIKYDADFILHSCTKYMEGHGAIIGGALIDSGNFVFDEDRYPLLFEPTPCGLSYIEKFKEYGFLMRLKSKVLMNTGGVMAPFHAYMLLHGLESFHVRMERHCQNAIKIAEFLSNHESISWVCFPGLPNHKSHQNAKKYLKGYFGAMIGFGIKGGFDACKKFINCVRLLSHTTNIGDVKTLVIHPASTTHRNLTDKEKNDAGISNDFIRLSVGIENVDDLIREIDRGLQNI